MRRLAVLLSVAFLLAAASARAMPPLDPGATPAPRHAAAPSDGPGWTVAILGGIGVMLVCGAAGVAAGRASVRPQAQTRVARHA
ncbi:MAG TPA: hypothetical protein VH418_18905 [Solirubrobacteraceae bacterium]|jgi:hypothetical protein